MRILRAADHKRMPWKNGGGETMEVAVFPEGAGLDDFHWRVSMARVDSDGPFSSFPGIDRTLAILDGAGIVLRVEGREDMRLMLESDPHAFPADVATSASLIDGSILDFNTMSRRGMVTHDVSRLRERRASTTASVRLVLCSMGSVELTSGDVRETLGQRDAALIDSDEAVDLEPASDSEFYLVEFRAVQAGR